jgi:hypothetical protein
MPTSFVKQKNWLVPNEGELQKHMPTEPYAEKIVRNCGEMDGEIRERGKFGWL